MLKINLQNRQCPKSRFARPAAGSAIDYTCLSSSSAPAPASIEKKKQLPAKNNPYHSCCPKHSAGKRLSSGALLQSGLNLLKSRKSQFYILTALVLIGYSTLLLQSFNITPDSSQNFRKVYDNFVFESSAAINNALFAQADVNEEFERFMDRFIDYSKMKKLDVEVFSILAVGDRVYFSNKMENTVRIMALNETIPKGANTYFLRSGLEDVVIEVRDDIFHENIYKFSISDKGTEAKAILRVRKGANRQIFVKD